MVFRVGDPDQRANRDLDLTLGAGTFLGLKGLGKIYMEVLCIPAGQRYSEADCGKPVRGQRRQRKLRRHLHLLIGVARPAQL